MTFFPIYVQKYVDIICIANLLFDSQILLNLFTFCIFFFFIVITRSNKNNYKHNSHLTNRFSSTDFQRLNRQKNRSF